jgi:inosine-uridine nucleoside N-ribohydrolase
MQAKVENPVDVILDTDIGPDCDDAAALAILHALTNMGEANIKAVMNCTSNPWGTGCIDAINTYYGRGNIPIGCLSASGFLNDEIYSTYNKFISNNFPNRFMNGARAKDAVNLYREILSSSDDKSIVIIAIGPLPNLSDLLNSHADDICPLNGIELVTKKVKQLVVMGGSFPLGTEWNIKTDIPSAINVTENWPTPITFAGYELGCEVITGKRLYTETDVNNPVRKSYELYLRGEKIGRSSWDLLAVLFGVRGHRNYWLSADNGKVEIDATGHNVWLPEINRDHSYLKPNMGNKQLEHILDDLLSLPPL